MGPTVYTHMNVYMCSCWYSLGLASGGRLSDSVRRSANGSADLLIGIAVAAFFFFGTGVSVG